MKTFFRILLIVLAIFLSVLAFRSIMRPEKYKSVYESRKTEIRNKLVALRAAQTVYKNEFKEYASDIDTLADFVYNGTVTIVKNVGNIPEGMTEAEAFKQGLLTKELMKIPAKERIIETDPTVAEFINGFEIIPHTKGKKFTIQTGSLSSSTYEIPVYRIDVPLDDVLANMDESIAPQDAGGLKRFYNYIIYNGLAEEEQYKSLYKPMWMGSLTDASVSGSWE